MATVNMKQLLDAGVHYGHQTRRWNPKMSHFIHSKRNGVYVIDLEKTVESLRKAFSFLRELARKDGEIIFVGTKRQAQDVIAEEARRCGVHFVHQKWLPGTLTNFITVKSSLNRLLALEEQLAENGSEGISKKEGGRIRRERNKLLRGLDGLRELTKIPDAIFVIDTVREHVVVAEAVRLQIPVVGIVDTNCNPDEITFPIPGNDDALRSIKLITGIMADAILEGRELRPVVVPEPVVEESPDDEEEKTESKDETSGKEVKAENAEDTKTAKAKPAKAPKKEVKEKTAEEGKASPAKKPKAAAAPKAKKAPSKASKKTKKAE